MIDHFSKQALSGGIGYAEAVKQLGLKGQTLKKFAQLCKRRSRLSLSLTL